MRILDKSSRYSEALRGVSEFAWELCKNWWALMSCAAFTVLSLISAVAKNGSLWIVLGTATLAAIFAFVSAYQAWDKQRQRADKAEADLVKTREALHVTAGDWQDIAEKLQTACRFVRSDYQRGTTIPYDNWSLPGCQGTLCEAWIVKAGAMLLKSPHVYSHLSKRVREEVDPKKRWLKYIDDKGAFRHHFVATETLDDGTVNHIISGTTHDLATDSAKLCIECSAMET